MSDFDRDMRAYAEFIYFLLALAIGGFALVVLSACGWWPPAWLVRWWP